MERVLYMNIKSSDYVKELARLSTWEEVVDEIYEQVDHVEPWMTGNCRGPSTAFCLLYKLCTMPLTGKQVHGLLTHTDSPYIRAIGFLYLRYMADSKTLLDWFEPYIVDQEEFAPGSNGKVSSIGAYVRDLLLGQYYYDSILPRIPLPVMRQITSHLERNSLGTQPSGVVASASRAGADDGGSRRPPSVKAALSVSFGQRAPHRASTRNASPVRRASRPPVAARPEPAADVEREKRLSREPERERSRSVHREAERPRNGREERNGGSDRERRRLEDDRDGSRRENRERDREQEREREREREKGRERDRERERDRALEREREREREGERRREQDSDRDKERKRDGRHYHESDRERRREDGGDGGERSRYRDRDRDRDVDRDQDRARDYRSHTRDGGRHASDGRREVGRGSSAEQGREKSREQLHSNERGEQKDRSRERSRDRRDPVAPSEASQSPDAEASARLRRLQERYGDGVGAATGSPASKRDDGGDDVLHLGRSSWR